MIAPLTPPTFIWTASPTSFPFLGIAAERRSRYAADTNSKFSRDSLPADPQNAVIPALNCPLQDPEKTAEDQEQHHPTQRACKQNACEGRPLEAELSKDMSAVQHPVPGGMSHQRGKDDGTHTFRDSVMEKELQHRDEQDEHKELPQFDA